MVYQIITYGNGEILKGVFDAIAICLNAQSGTLYIPLIRLSMIIGGLWVALYAIYGDYIRAINGWLIPITVIMHLLFVPQASVWINDPVSQYHQKVNHVPYGLAIVASRISTIFDAITCQIEKVFVLHDDLKYQKHGTIFASNLLQQAKTFRITNEDLAENMRQFVGQCVTIDVILGHKYTLEDLRNSDDIWQLVSKDASPVRSFVWKDLKKANQPPTKSLIITCADGVKKFNALWSDELQNTATIFGKKIFGKNSYLNPKTELLKYLPLAYATLTNMSKSADDILKQHMMIYAVVDGIEQKSASLGNAPNFALRRTYLQQRSNYETLGAMAAEMLPTMKAALEAITYAAFLFVVPLAILPFGWTFLKNWVGILLWLQSWAPMYAILNYIMTLAAGAKSRSALLGNEIGVTIANSVGLANVNADIALMTGYLSMSIPFLCVAIIKGVSSLVSVPGILTGVTQNVAASAASEAATGNYSFANISEGNQQISNKQMLQHSYAASYRNASFQQFDGRTDITTTSDGQQLLNVASSNLPVSLNFAAMKSSQLSEQAGKSYRQALQQSGSYATNLASTLNKSVELSDYLTNAQQSSDQYTDHKSSEEIRALNITSQIIKDFAVDHNLTTTQGSQILAVANANVGLKDKALINPISGSLGFNLNANISADANNQEIYRQAEKIVEGRDFQDALRQGSQLTHNLSSLKHDDQGKKLADSLNHAWNQSNSFRTEATNSFNQSLDYHKQATVTRNSSASINANYNQQFIDWLAKQPADNTMGGHIGKMGAAHIIMHSPDEAMQYAERFTEERNILPATPQQLKDLKPSAIEESYKSENRHVIVEVSQESAQHSMDHIKDLAVLQGLTEAPAHNLQQKFNNRHQAIDHKLNNSQQNLRDEYDQQEIKHNKQAKKNLFWSASKKLLNIE